MLDLTGIANQLTDLADVERVIVALGLCLRVNNVWVFPGLQLSVYRMPPSSHATHPREGTIVPEVTLVREAVADESKLSFLDVLLDRVPRSIASEDHRYEGRLRACIQEFVFGDLLIKVSGCSSDERI